jgi:hypothetical protein
MAKSEDKRTIAEKLADVMDPNAAMGKGAAVTRTQETGVSRSLHKFPDPAVYDDEGNIIGYVEVAENGRFASSLDDVAIGGDSITREEAEEKVKKAHASRQKP